MHRPQSFENIGQESAYVAHLNHRRYRAVTCFARAAEPRHRGPSDMFVALACCVLRVHPTVQDLDYAVRRSLLFWHRKIPRTVDATKPRLDSRLGCHVRGFTARARGALGVISAHMSAT